MSAPSIEERRDCPHGYQWGKCDVCDRMECERELAAMTARAEAAERERDEYRDDYQSAIDECCPGATSPADAQHCTCVAPQRIAIKKLTAERDLAQAAHVICDRERQEAREEVERLTKLNDLLMGDKHDWERDQRRSELLEGMRSVKSRFTPRYFAPSNETAIAEAAAELAAVDAALDSAPAVPHNGGAR